MPKCAIAECGATHKSSNADSEPLKFHRFPTNPRSRKKWILTAGRAPNWKPREYNYVCSRHFKIEDYDSSGWKLHDGTVPSLNLPSTRSTDTAQDPLQTGVETEVIKIKVESDEFSAEEDDLLEKLEKKRQREKEVTQTVTKKPKLENCNAIPVQKRVEIPKETNGPSTSSCDEKVVMVPEIFMKNMLRTQNEIMETLKTQVLMQNPDPKLLTFLRFLGAKMQKLSDQRRRELIDIITKMALQEYDV